MTECGINTSCLIYFYIVHSIPLNGFFFNYILNVLYKICYLEILYYVLITPFKFVEIYLKTILWNDVTLLLVYYVITHVHMYNVFQQLSDSSFS